MALYMYVTVSGEGRVARYEVDGETGELRHLGDTGASGRPAPMAADPGGRFAYVARRDANIVSSYRIESGGGLAHIGDVGVESDPCFLATDRSGRWLLSAYYEGGFCAVHAIGDGGSVAAEPAARVATARGAHSMQCDPTNRFAFVPHISGGTGPNAIYQFRFDAESGGIAPNEPAVLGMGSELGPRHFCFHPDKPVVYFSDEQGCSVTAYRLDGDTGTLTAFQTVSTLPPGWVGRNSCSQIQIAPSGRFLYAPNRGHNSIACFAVDGDSEELRAIGHAASEAVPRAFSLDPGGRFLYAAGLETGRLAAYRVGDDGLLTRLGTYDVGREPMWVLVCQVVR